MDSVSLHVEVGERLGILGPNGAGKTTLVKLLLGTLEPTRGQIEVFGVSPRAARERGWIGYVAQRSGAELAFPLTVRQVVAMPLRAQARPWARLTADANELIDRSLTLTGAAAFEEVPIGRVSGGQLQRALIARALVKRPRLLVLDEPTVGIDVAGQQQFARMLEHLQHELGVTMVIVTHDLRTIAAGCDRVACLHRTLHAHVSPSGLTPAVLAEVFRHEVEGIFGHVHVDAHAAAECSDPTHAHGPATPGTPEGHRGADA